MTRRPCWLGPNTSTLDLDGLVIEVVWTWHPGTPGRYSGPPEDCYPDEPGELEIESFDLVIDVEDDLGLKAPPRVVHVDLSPFLRFPNVESWLESQLENDIIEIERARYEPPEVEPPYSED